MRRRVLQALPYRDELLLNIVDALSVGPRPITPSEVALSPLWGLTCSTLYSGLRQGGRSLHSGPTAAGTPGVVAAVGRGVV